MNILIKNAFIVDGISKKKYKGNVYIEKGLIKKIEKINKPLMDENADNLKTTKDLKVINGEGLYLAPGFIDLHVHFRDPGALKKEDIFTGMKAAAAGGFTTVLMMPNTKPSLHSKEVIKELEKKYKKNTIINLLYTTAMTLNQAGKEIVNFEEIDKLKTRAKKLTGHTVVGISEDGKTLENGNLMKEVLRSAKKLGVKVFDHPEPETKITKRDIRLAKETGTHIHIQHVSKKETVDFIRKAKKKMKNITCETAPHYFSLTKNALRKKGSLAKMNPPLCEKEDREEIIKGIKDNTIDIIATDHAPHTKKEKDVPVKEAPFGIIGLETAFQIANTFLVKGGHISLEELVKKMSTVPARLIKIKRGTIKEGEVADLTLFDAEKETIINSNNFLSKGRNTPFDKQKVKGEIKKVFLEGKEIFSK